MMKLLFESILKDLFTLSRDQRNMNPMEKALQALKTAPKCLAHARTTGEPCKNASMKNGRCKMHGGKSTGRPIIHGLRTRKSKQNVTEVKYLINTIDLIT